MRVTKKHTLLKKLIKVENRLTKSVSHLIHIQKKTLDRLKESYAFRYHEQLIRQKELEMDKAIDRLEKVTLTQLTVRRDRFISVYRRLLAQHPKKQLNDSKLTFNRIMKHNEQVFRRKLDKK